MSGTEPAIRTTVVGSYPAPDWLGRRPSRSALRDAVMVVLKTQELAGIDVVTDGGSPASIPITRRRTA